MDKDVHFACSECGLHYTTETLAQTCSAWCAEHKSCNMDITALSVERNAAETSL